MELYTTCGMIEETELDKVELPVQDSDNECITAQEYYYGGALVRRDVQIVLKKSLTTTVEGSL
jgi:hypothetical protein